MWRNIASNALTLGIVVLVLLGGLLAWAQREFTRPGPLEQAICLRVERGDTIGAVSDALADKGAITVPAIFRLGAQYTGRDSALRFGSWLVPAHASMDEILARVTRGGASDCGAEVNYRIGVETASTLAREVDPATGDFEEIVNFSPETSEIPEEYQEISTRPDTRFRVTLAEGATSWQVVEALSRAPFLTGEIEEIPDEGMLAPGSYEVARGTPRPELITQMQARQESILSDLWAGRAEGLPLETPQEALILASIIEKETAVADERPEVASVFMNRLERPMRLQTDPTVIYGITEGRGTLDRGLRQSELDAETPYNTYLVDGLPPTPIANPGRASIAAAVNPADTDYLYFVADGSGGHAFAETLAEHNRNVARWRQIQDDAGAE